MKRALIVLSALSMPLVSAAEEPVEVKPNVTKLALFKNGYGYVTMSFSPSAESGYYRIADMPIPVYGTLWIETDGKSSVSFLRGKQIEKKETLKGGDMIKLALANPGKYVTVTYRKGEAKAMGSIILLQDEEDKSTGDAAETPQFLCIADTKGGTTVIPVGEVESIQFMEKGVLKLPATTVKEPVMDVYMKKADPSDPVRMTMISSGITWLPSYRMELGEDGKGQFQAQADIINEFRDMENVELELVTGFPSIYFSVLPAPVLMRQSMSSYLTALNGSSPVTLREKRSRVAAAPMMENSVSYSMDAGSAPVDNGLLPPMEAMSPADSVRVEDLFFYPVKGFSCKKDETLSIPLFSGEIPYEHVMTWDVGELFQRDDAPQDIWHCVRITNTLEVPLTAAPVEFMSKGRFIGQSLIKLTPKGMKCIVRVNKSMDVVASGKENVKSQESASFLKTNRTKLTVGGELTIINHGDKPATVLINKTLTGIVTASSDKGDASQSEALRDGMNPASLIKWEITIPAGEKKVLTYSYTRMN